MALPDFNINIHAKDLATAAFNRVRASATNFSNQVSSSFSRIRANALSAAAAISAVYLVVQQRQAQILNEVRLEHRLSQLGETRIRQLKELAKEQERLGVVTDEAILGALSYAGAVTQNEDQLRRLAVVLGDTIAAQAGVNATHQDGVRVGKAFLNTVTGEITSLRELGVNISDVNREAFALLSVQERTEVAIDRASKAYRGFNEQLAEASGSIDDVGTQLNNLSEQFGSFLVDTRLLDLINVMLIGLTAIGKLVSSQVVESLKLLGVIKEQERVVINLTEEERERLAVHRATLAENQKQETQGERLLAQAERKLGLEKSTLDTTKQENRERDDLLAKLDQQVAYLQRVYGTGLSEEDERAARIRAQNPSFNGRFARDDPARQFYREPSPNFQQHEIQQTIQELTNVLVREIRRQGTGGRSVNDVRAPQFDSSL